MWRRVGIVTLAAGLGVTVFIAGPRMQKIGAQQPPAFDSGSNGSYGPIDVTTGAVTLPMPADGVFHATTVSVAAGATLRFTRNALNTPVVILASGDITIAGTIDISGSGSANALGGRGGPGGFDGGSSGPNVSAGHGPGGGGSGTNDSTCGGVTATTSGGGSFGSREAVRALNGAVYGGPILIPLIGGSGGGGSTIAPRGAGGGGGAILLASSTRITVSGAINAVGGTGYSDGAGCGQRGGSGSGGGVRLVAPVVAGGGRIDVGPYPETAQQGGHGRIRVDALSNQSSLVFAPASAVTTGAFMHANPIGPRLDVVSVAGQDIPVGTGTPATVLLPPGQNVNQPVVVQAQDFPAGGTIPITIALIPTGSARTTVNASITMSTNPATVSTNVTFPAGVVTQVQVWTR